jgi:hypothetical protein
MEWFGKFIFSVMIGAVAVISQSFAAVILWRWFVIPFFHLPPLTWSVAYGFILILAVVHTIPDPERKDDSFTAVISRVIGSGIIGPWIAVGIGWIIK